MKLGFAIGQQAQSFHAKSQGRDAAWPMTSRAIMGDGKVATKFEPIAHSAIAWAVMGLVRSAPAKIKPVKPSKKGTDPFATVDIHEDYPLDEAQFAAWVKQASQLSGERM